MVSGFLLLLYGIGGAVVLFLGGQALVAKFKKDNEL